MPKLLLAVFLLCSFVSKAQFSPTDTKISRDLDPEVLWFQKDSLAKIDTTKAGIDLVEYYKQRYYCENTLYFFDRNSARLYDCMKSCSAQYFHDTTTIEPLINGLEASFKLNDKDQATNFYNLIRKKSNEKDWTENQSRRINTAASTMGLKHSDPNDPVDFGYSYRPIACTIDTVALIHAKSNIKNNKTIYEEYELKSGKNYFLELSENAHDCKCIDCSYSSKTFIKLNGNSLPRSMELDSLNCFSSMSNVWADSPRLDVRFGKLFRNENGLYVVIAYKNTPTDELFLVEMDWIAPEKLNGL